MWVERQLHTITCTYSWDARVARMRVRAATVGEERTACRRCNLPASKRGLHCVHRTVCGMNTRFLLPMCVHLYRCICFGPFSSRCRKNILPQHFTLYSQTQELEVHGEDQHLEHDQPRCVDNPALDHVDTYVNDLYLATARPRFDPNPICLRRQRENASVAAGALINSLGGVDRWTNQPAKPTDKVGDQRAESLEFGARMLIK